MVQVNSEFQAFKHIESVGKGELMKATRPLEVTLAVYPTLVLTNALPYDIVVWQVNQCNTVWCVCHTPCIICQVLLIKPFYCAPPSCKSCLQLHPSLKHS